MNIAIIGAGPRGLAALESLAIAISGNKVKFDGQILLFEKTDCLGTGPIYSQNQEYSNWINISERGATIPCRQEFTLQGECLEEFPSFHEWTGLTDIACNLDEPDVFPPRAYMGRYLSERYQSIAKVLTELQILRVHHTEITSIKRHEDVFLLTSKDEDSWKVEEVAITVGHQSTEFSQQWKNWKEFAQSTKEIYAIDYPYLMYKVIRGPHPSPNYNVALRGFGLAMIDALRGLTVERKGHFYNDESHPAKLKYIRSGLEPKLIIPFSLDGLPMAPKPLTPKIDSIFTPTSSQLNILEGELKHTATKGEALSIDFLLEKVSNLSASIFISMGDKGIAHNLSVEELEHIAMSYLKDDDFEHELLLSKRLTTYSIMDKFVGMATLLSPISYDFCIGHVWRHCQPSFYNAFSFSNLDDTVMTAIIEKDEQMKRYAYGPPVQSIQQILALIDAGIVTLDHVRDPSITISDSGWKFGTLPNNTAQVMVNTILDPPAINKVNSPIITNLLSHFDIELVDSDLGIATREDACIILNDKSSIPLAIMGRLAKGTLLGVDAILECFNDRADKWAKSVTERMQEVQPNKVFY